MISQRNNAGIATITLILLGLGVLAGGGYLFLQNLQAQLLAKITGCQLESKNFHETIDFEYINDWIVVKAKIGDSDKEYPFIFDTGAQTVLLDSLLDDIGAENYQSFSSGTRNDTSDHAFNNEILSLKSLKLGNVRFSDVGSISAINSKWEMLNCVSPYGVIGYNLLQTMSIRIDYTNQKITLTDNVANLENSDEIHWVNYKPLSTQESPIVQVVINNDIKAELLFDTGLSAGVKLVSDSLFNLIGDQNSNKIIRYSSRPSLHIRGEKHDIEAGILFQASSLLIGDLLSKDLEIVVKNGAEREYDGLLGNRYLENFIITLDYENRRIGFLGNHTKSTQRESFGLSYLAQADKIAVSSVYHGSEPDLVGIRPGDEIYSINGIVISELPAQRFCESYRGEHHFEAPEDSTLQIGIFENDSLVTYTFTKQKLL